MDRKMKELFDLSGKVAFVTGGALGIGREIAMRLAESGAAVIVSDTDLEKARAVVADLRVAGCKAKEHQAVPGEIPEAEKAIWMALAVYGGLHILVTTAEIRPAEDEETTEDDNPVEIGLRETELFSEAAARAMADRNHGGKIVTVAGIDSFHEVESVSQLTRKLAGKWAPERINVNAVVHGAIDIPPVKEIGDEGDEGDEVHEGHEAGETAMEPVSAMAPIGRRGKPGDVAGAVLYFASGAADFVTGVTLTVDGGSSLDSSSP
ncbi:SDR family oxidoreductase [Dehalogenimonas sp. THU2]|uniref:SDR family NAD(P)-dependent oxidoreductase n=1 Tax=Dehalogenimonas sp. THU2 TaxID=3151121 RepID=UPI00321846C1